MLQTAPGHVYIRLLEEDDNAEVVVGQTQQYMEIVFRRVNNAFVRRLTLSFDRAHLPPLNHLRANAKKLQCHIRALRIESTEAAIDYALVDFLGAHLKPQAYEVSKTGELRENHVKLFKHDALRDKVKHLVYEASKCPPYESAVTRNVTTSHAHLFFLLPFYELISKVGTVRFNPNSAGPSIVAHVKRLLLNLAFTVHKWRAKDLYRIVSLCPYEFLLRFWLHMTIGFRRLLAVYYGTGSLWLLTFCYGSGPFE